jgi:hypothetical protein
MRTKTINTSGLLVIGKIIFQNIKINICSTQIDIWGCSSTEQRTFETVCSITASGQNCSINPPPPSSKPGFSITPEEVPISCNLPSQQPHVPHSPHPPFYTAPGLPFTPMGYTLPILQ